MAKLAYELGLSRLVRDPAFRTDANRVHNPDALVARLEDVLQTSSSEHWGEGLVAAGVPAAPFLDLDQALAHPQVHARQILVRLPDENDGEIGAVGSPIKLLGSPVEMEAHAPRLGEHTGEVLADLELDAVALDMFYDRGVTR